eukprot:jgi/Tetstr1/464964/TSEL_009698.t1
MVKSKEAKASADNRRHVGGSIERKKAKKEKKTKKQSKIPRKSGRMPEQGGEASEIAYYQEWRALRDSWPEEMAILFTAQVSDERRAELFQLMAEQGEPLRGKYAWAIPDQRAIRIIANFSPLVEIGAGKGYWAMLLRQAGADVLALDITGSSRKKGAAPGKKGLQGQWSEVRKGGPKVLQTVETLGRTLFLCYPDEYEHTCGGFPLRAF